MRSDSIASSAGDPESVLLDTNILVYAADMRSPQHEAACRIRESALKGDVTACLTAQVLFEFFAIITNPRRTASAVSAEEAVGQVEAYLRAGFRMLHPGPGVVVRAMGLVRQARLSGQAIYDAVLAATMLENGVTTIYTADVKDFRFPGLRAINPLIAARR